MSKEREWNGLEECRSEVGWWEKRRKRRKNGKSGRGVGCPIGFSAAGFFSGAALVLFGQDSAGDRTAETTNIRAVKHGTGRIEPEQSKVMPC